VRPRPGGASPQEPAAALVRYLFVTAPGQSGGLEAPAHELAEQFRAHGHEVDLLHTGGGDFTARLQALLGQRRPDIALSWGGFGDQLMFRQEGAEAQNLWSSLRIPFGKIVFDVHAYMPQHHHVRGGFQFLCYAFKDHAVLRARSEQAKPGARGAMIACLPPLLPLLPEAERGAIVERTLHFNKNGNSSAALEQSWESFPRPLRQALREIAHAMCDDIDRAFVIEIADAVERYIAAFAPERHRLPPFRDFILAQVDDYVRRLKGELLVRQLKDLPVVVNGRQWGYLKDELGPCRLSFIEVADHRDTSRRIKSSLGTIDISPNVDLSLHERSLRAIAFGHGLIAYENGFVREHGVPHTFKLADGSLPALVERVLGDPGATDEFEAFRDAFIAQYPLGAALDYFTECAALVHFANGRDPGIPDYLWWPTPERPSG
jgi:hypothetical protein